MRELSAEAEALWRRVEVAIAGRSLPSSATRTHGAGATGSTGSQRVLELLVQLAGVAPESSEAWAYAHRELASLLYENDPWRASICARRALSVSGHDPVAWGILGLTQSMLGNHAFAERAYRRALRLDPKNPFYAHNLGHLLDVVYDRHDEAVPLLELAVHHLWEWPEVCRRHRLEMVASLAHALCGAGQLAAAHAHMRGVMQSGSASNEHHALYDHILEVLERSVEREMAMGSAPPTTRGIRRRCHTGEGMEPRDAVADPSID